MLRSCDGQLFCGYGGFASMRDQTVAQAVDDLTLVVAELLQAHKESLVVISGAGTSGRIALVLARAYNRLLVSHGRRPCVQCLIAGGQPAFTSPVEHAEDSAKVAVDDLRAVEYAASAKSAKFGAERSAKYHGMYIRQQENTCTFA